MDLWDFYFKQIVTQAQMDWVFERAQAADHSMMLDNDFVGIVEGLAAQQHAPTPDKNVDLVGPGIAYDKDGQRVYVPSLLTVVDCSQDEFGTDTDPPTVGYERYISIFVRFDRDLTEPAQDGNNITVYTKQLESFEIFVRQGSEASAGTAVPAPLMDDAILLIDILVAHGFTAITTGDFDETRREDWVRFTGGAIGDRVYGTAQEAVEDILSLINGWGGALPFTFTSQWFGPTAVAGASPPPSTVQEALNAIVYDLALNTTGKGATLVGMPSAGWLGAGNVHSVFTSLLTALANQAPTSGADRIGVAPVVGVPESIVAGTVQAVLAAFLAHINNRPERDETEVITGGTWEYRQSGTVLTDEKYFDVQGGMRGNSIIGGSAPMVHQLTAAGFGFPYSTMISDDHGDEDAILFGLQMVDICQGHRIGTTVHGDQVYTPTIICAFYDSKILTEFSTRNAQIYVGAVTSHDLTVDLGADAIIQIVADGTQIYILTDAGGTGLSMNLYAYDLATWSQQWVRALPMSCGAGGNLYRTKMKYMDDFAGNRGVIICAGNEDVLVGTSVAFVADDNSVASLGNSNATLAGFPTDICFDPNSGEIILSTTSAQVCSAIVNPVGAGSYGPYPIGSGNVVALLSDKYNVWMVSDGPGPPTMAIGAFNATVSAVDANRCQHDLGEIDVTSTPTVRGAALAYDGKRMWVSYYYQASRSVTFVNRRGCLSSWYVDSLHVFQNGLASADKMPINQRRHYCTPPDRDGAWPGGGLVGRALYIDGYIYTIHNWADPLWSSLARVPASLWR